LRTFLIFCLTNQFQSCNCLSAKVAFGASVETTYGKHEGGDGDMAICAKTVVRVSVLLIVVVFGAVPAFSEDQNAVPYEKSSPLFEAALKNGLATLSSAQVAISPGVTNHDPITDGGWPGSAVGGPDSLASEKFAEARNSPAQPQLQMLTRGRTCAGWNTCAGSQTCGAAATCRGITCQSVTCGESVTCRPQCRPSPSQ